MLNFPSKNRFVGRRYPDPTIPETAVWQWDGVKWGRVDVDPDPDAPSDDNYYVRKDNAWVDPDPFARPDSPIFTGIPVALTPAQTDSSARVATTEFVQTLISAPLLLATKRINQDYTIVRTDNAVALIVDASAGNIRLDAAADLPESGFLIKLVRLDASTHRITCDFTTHGYRVDGRQRAPLINRYDTATLRKIAATDFITEAARYPRSYYFYSSEDLPYTTARNFTFDPDADIPLGCTAIQVVVTGGGGGCGGAFWNGITGYRGNGGAGGGTAIKTIRVSELGSNPISITVGPGGTAGITGNSNQTNGGRGGTTSFGSFVSAIGGSGGTRAVGAANVGDDGGDGIDGDVNLKGGPSFVTNGSSNSANVSGGGMSGGGWGSVQWHNVAGMGLLYGGGASSANHIGGGTYGGRGQCTVFVL